MFLKLNCEESVLANLVNTLQDFAEKKFLTFDNTTRTIFISPSENDILKIIDFTRTEGVLIKFVFVCKGTEYDIEDWQIARRVYSGIFDNGFVDYIKYDDFNYYSDKEKNDFYGIIDYVFGDSSEINHEIKFTTNLFFYTEISKSLFSFNEIITEKYNVYDYLLDGTISYPRQILQYHDNSFGFLIDKINIDQNQFPTFIKNIEIPKIDFVEGLISHGDQYGKIIFFDLETTGLPRKGIRESVHNWPDIVQISWVIYTFNGELIEIGDKIIKPSMFNISKQAEEIHGISQKYALTHGEEFHEVMETFINKMKHTDIIVSHNLEFDMTVLFTSVYKYKLRTESNKHFVTDISGKILWSTYYLNILFKYFGDDRFNSNAFTVHDIKIKNRMFFCTMIESSKTLFKERKWRELKDLYFELFNKLPEITLHNSLNDIWVTKECFYELYKRGLVRNESQRYFLNDSLFNEITEFKDLSDQNNSDKFPF